MKQNIMAEAVLALALILAIGLSLIWDAGNPAVLIGFFFGVAGLLLAQRFQ